ncbi:MAG: GHMP kinase [Oscillospiraceae bacterium]|nr:GHMP kinase [Oscillospiraceae bacterium]
MLCEKRYFELFRREPEGLAFCPYRVCPIGAHSDHNLGKITGFAIDRGIHIAYGPGEDGRVEVVSLQFPAPARWDIAAVPEAPRGDWADYLRGACRALGKRFPLRRGLRGVIEGSLPIGGLSSSAAVILAFLSALCRVNGLSLSPRELIDTAWDAEKNYVGVSVGTLDQSCEVLGKKDCLLYLDTADGSYERIPAGPGMKPWQIAVFFSGLEHSLAGSGYNTRVDELRAGVYALQAFAGLEHGSFAETNARAVPFQVFEAYKDRLPAPWARRCEHWYGEFRRVEAGAEAWRRGDVEEFGRLSFESGRSSIDNWESGAPEQIRLYEILRRTEGVYGGRFSGAGFKGSCIALIDPDFRERIAREVTEAYLKAFPALEGKYAVYFCESADGAQL